MNSKSTAYISFSLLTISVTIFSILVYSKMPVPIQAANVLTNPSFTGGITGWTPGGSAAYYASYYQDSAGSAGTETAVGRNNAATGDVSQTLSAQVEGGSVVSLSGYWSKQCVAEICSINTITVDVQLGVAGYQTVWQDTSIPAAGSPTSWAAISAIDISSYFTTTGTYSIRLTYNLRNPNNGSAQSLAWFDNLILDVTPPNITVGTTGTQVAEVPIGSQNEYIGGAFSFIRDGGSTSVTSITISQTGTIADSDISGLILYYKQESSCSTSIPGDATQFNSTPGTFSSGSSTVTGSMTVGTSQICVYVEVDIGSGATIDETVEIQITNPSTDVSATLGTISPSSPVAISGTTYIVAAGVLSIDIVDDLDQTVSSPSVIFTNITFDWDTQLSTGTLGTSTERIKVSNFSVNPEWTLSIAATGGASAVWQGASYSYNYNGTAENGRLQVNPQSATITPGGSCTDTGLTKQSATYFVSGSVDSINIVVAGATAETECDWYITGIGLTQDIPAMQMADDYAIEMTLTVL